MDPQEALFILDEFIARTPMRRDEHVRAQRALAVIADALRQSQAPVMPASGPNDQN